MNNIYQDVGGKFEELRAKFIYFLGLDGSWYTIDFDNKIFSRIENKTNSNSTYEFDSSYSSYYDQLINPCNQEYAFNFIFYFFIGYIIVSFIFFGLSYFGGRKIKKFLFKRKNRKYDENGFISVCGKNVPLFLL